MDGKLIYYQFGRSRVERLDFNHFLSLYAPDRLPVGSSLQSMMNKMVFGIEGWDQDPRDILIIPEVRRFYSAFHEAWPYWLYFCNLKTETLNMMMLCCLPSVSAMNVDGQPTVGVKYDRLELLRFVGKDFEPMNDMCGRAGMTERSIYDRSKAVFTYFGMPFDAEPPDS